MLNMTWPSFISILFLLCSSLRVSAKVCRDLVITIEISCENNIYNIPQLASNLDCTTFAQNVTNIGGTFPSSVFQGTRNITGRYNIGATFCHPNNQNYSTTNLQFLTHGIGYDRSYWDYPFKNYTYSYLSFSVDVHGHSTFAIDRFGIGSSFSPLADPLNDIQFQAQLLAIATLTSMLREGSISGIPKYQKTIHVGHSIGSALSYALAATQPDLTDGLLLTGWTLNQTLLSTTIAGLNYQLARLNSPRRFGRYPNSYMTWSDGGTDQYASFTHGYFDPDILPYAEAHKQPYTTGEILTITDIPASAPGFTGPVLIIVGDNDRPYCGGNCYATGDPSTPSIAAAGASAFPNAQNFSAYIQPNTGHALNLHYNATGAFQVMGSFFRTSGLDEATNFL